MNIIDVLIILFALGSLARGYHIGLVRQLGSTLGFIGGLFLGSWFSSFILTGGESDVAKSIISLLAVLLVGLLGMTLGELVGIRIKQKLSRSNIIDTFDGGLGSIVAAVTLVFAIWLAASIVVLGPTSGLRQELKSSKILSALNLKLPPATRLLGSLNKLIDPNDFPQVFRGLEPSPDTSTTVPSLGSLSPVVTAAQPSIVKVEGTGCGGIVEGSGFVFAAGHIVTNAHVVAGVKSPKVIDGNGVHDTTVVLFDPNVDLAVLQVSNLAGKPLTIDSTERPTNTPGVVLGYPGGGNFNAQAAAIMDHFTALGRNIYDRGSTARDVYSLHAKVIPGNSGGPLVGIDGSVLGIVFATSTTYNNVGYALTGHQVAGELMSAQHATTAISTGSCSDT